eukprot:TRINITY_DN2067_c0_g2_i1.p3 TRINITY_DN2067_c0_g2~~TRINITY_DN2067_c0_g2_i1.p3  ORF type:complete len:143 (+),score=55.62 TRINITY_DN2067_c0_g2_i1:105-533(+)
MDPGWFVLCCFLVVEAVLVGILVLPMPSNTVRGFVLQSIGKLTANKNVRYFSLFVLLLDIWYFYDCMEHLYGDHSVPHTGGRGEIVHRFRQQRNAYITAGGVFLCLVLNRLVDLQSQIFEYRKVMKDAGIQKPRAGIEKKLE